MNHTGGPLDLVAGQSVDDFVDPAYHVLLRNAVAKACNAGVPQHYNFYAVNADDKRSYYSNWVMALISPAAEGFVDNMDALLRPPSVKIS